MSIANNRLDQAIDISGSLTQKQNLVNDEEPNQLGSRISGQTGSLASINVSGATVTISGLTGMVNESTGRFLTILGSASPLNNGTFLISEFNNSNSVNISNSIAITDVNNGSISWIERDPYSLEDDINYIRTDRQAIKGTLNWHDSIPTYLRCDNQLIQIEANLSNIAGNTTDAKAFVLTRKFENAIVNIGDGYIFVQAIGVLPYADSVNRLGVPINDGYDIGNNEATYCDIIDPETGAGLIVLTGINQGNRIFGIARQGLNGVDGNSFEIELCSVVTGSPLISSVSYIWETGQPSIVDVFYPFRECLANMSETALRTMMIHGLISDAGLDTGTSSIPEPTEIGQFLYTVDSTNLVFTAERPIINNDGFIIVNDNDLIVV